MKTTKIILLMIVIFTPTIYNVNITLWEENIKKQIETGEKVVPKTEKLKTKINKRRDKKVLKKEIQNRKKYHKSLIEAYNSDFNQKNLEMIKNNALIIDSLENKLKKI